MSEQELLGIVEAAAEDEVIEHEERELIESIIEFGDTVAREVMVPRPDMVTVTRHGRRSSDALDIAIEHGYSRLPVVGESHRRRRRHRLHEGPDAGRARGARLPAGRRPRCARAHFVPETKPVARLMREMQAEQVPHGDPRRRVRRHRRAGHARGLPRGARRRHRRRVRRRGRRGRAPGRRRAAGRRRPRHRRAERAARASTCPTRTGTPSAASCSARSATCPTTGESVEYARLPLHGGEDGRPAHRAGRGRVAWPPSREPDDRASRRARDRLPVGLRDARRAAQRRQVDAAERDRGREGVSIVSDKPQTTRTSGPRHPPPARRPGRVRRHARHPQAGDRAR